MNTHTYTGTGTNGYIHDHTCVLMCTYNDIFTYLIYLYRCIRNEGIKRPCDRTNDDRPADLEYSMFKQTYTTTYHHTYIYISMIFLYISTVDMPV